MYKKLIILLFLIVSSTSAQNTFIEPFKLGSYYEYVYEEWGTQIRYSAKIVSEETVKGRTFQRMDIYNEPPMNIHTIYFYFDTLTLNIYGGEGARCPDSLGLKLAAGFKFPVGYIWNDCPSGAYFRSKINFKIRVNGFFGTSDSLWYVERKDTIGGTIQATTYYSYAEKFGYVYFYRGYGSPLLGGSYSKSMVGAIIDGVTYGSILLDVTKISNEIPSGYILEQNYPNPFNPSTIIKFSLPKTSFVTLKIYNQLGKEVSTLVNEKKSTGTYQHLFNATNIPSGIYFYTLQSDDYIETKKMILMK